MPHSIWISPSPCIQIIAWSFYLTCKSSLMKTSKRNAWSFISGVIAFNRYLQRPCNLKFCEKRCTCATFRALASRWRRAKSYTWKQLGRGWLFPLSPTTSMTHQIQCVGFRLTQISWFHFLVYEKWLMSTITTKFEHKIRWLPCLKFDNNLSFIWQTQLFFVIDGITSDIRRHANTRQFFNVLSRKLSSLRRRRSDAFSSKLRLPSRRNYDASL